MTATTAKQLAREIMSWSEHDQNQPLFAILKPLSDAHKAQGGNLDSPYPYPVIINFQHIIGKPGIPARALVLAPTMGAKGIRPIQNS